MIFILSPDELFWLYLNNREKMNVVQFSDLYFKYQTKENFIKAIKRGEVIVSTECKQEILTDSWKDVCYKIIDYMDRKNIYVILSTSQKFPKIFSLLDLRVPILYCIGDMSLLDEDCVSIIGSRVSSSYGRKCAENFSKTFSEHGICVVSGLTDGIDACAHRGAIDSNGKTIAVLACGVDVVYPQSNFSLYEDICNKGLVISEFPLMSKPQKGNFPYRNRLISGLSKCLIVAEAGMPSGTMSTVDFALDQGKNVYAIPGGVNSETSAGTNLLIQNGCFCAIDPLDVLIEFGRFKVDKNNGPIPYDENLDSLQNDILKLLTVENLTFEQFEEALNADADQLNMALTMLEICGYVEKEAGRIYSLKR